METDFGILDLNTADPSAIRNALYGQSAFEIADLWQISLGSKDSLEGHVEEIIKKLSAEIMGIDCKYIVLTNGATQALDAVLNIYKNMDYSNVFTELITSPIHFGVVHKNGLTLNDDHKQPRKTVHLVTSPNNPNNQIYTKPLKVDIFDASYNNPVYKKLFTPAPDADFIIGSFSTLFGLPGFRIGWVGTHTAENANKVSQFMMASTGNLSGLQTASAMQVLKNFAWDKDLRDAFYSTARAKIDNNKTELLKILHIFDNQNIDNNGMFYFPKADHKATNILNKAGVDYCHGFLCGDQDSIRLNLAVVNHLFATAVQKILKADSLK